MRGAVCLLLITAALCADDLDEFDLIEFPQVDRTREVNDAFSLSGSVSLRAAYQFEKTSVRDRIRELQARGGIESRFAPLENGFFKLSAEGVLEGAKEAAAKNRIELSEAFFQARIGAGDIKIGRQIAVWGKSDMIRVTDALNPLDMQEPAMSDVSNLRLGVTMAKVDFYAGDWDLQAIAIPEIRFGKLPNAPSEFAQIEIEDDRKPKGTQGAIAAIGAFEGWDLSLYAASLYLDKPLYHERANMIGAAIALAVGDFVFKGEAAFWDEPDGDYEKRDFLLGAEYYGFSDATITVEAANSREDRADAQTYAARIEREFFNARLKLSALSTVNYQDGKNGGFARVQGAYELSDDYAFTIGAVCYFGSLPPYGAFDRNDRLFLRLNASF
ncbi:MAG: hypothetical protein LBT81_01725 [Helicobacteraceae bacterium]|jgi:hypothetical protein|nr:hypothetical protein [Helicobacteraceae bacterium]